MKMRPEEQWASQCRKTWKTRLRFAWIHLRHWCLLPFIRRSNRYVEETWGKRDVKRVKGRGGLQFVVDASSAQISINKHLFPTVLPPGFK